MRTQHIID